MFRPFFQNKISDYLYQSWEVKLSHPFITSVDFLLWENLKTKGPVFKEGGLCKVTASSDLSTNQRLWAEIAKHPIEAPDEAS